MALSFRTKLLASHIGVVVVAGAISLLMLDRFLAIDLVRQLDQRLEEQARGAIEWAQEGGRRHPEKVAVRISRIVDAEVTLFDRDGNVLGASAEDARSDMGPEVEEARVSGIGRASRRRRGEEFHYVAVPSAEGIVVRLGVPLADVNETVASTRQRLLFASSVAIAVALALGLLGSRLASRPLGEMTRTATRLARGDFRVQVEADSDDEFGVLWRALKSLAEQLETRIGELVAERDRLSAILEGMVEGVLVVDRRGVIVANPAAERILGTTKPLAGTSLEQAVRDEETRRAIDSCMRGRTEESDLEIVDRRGATLALYVRALAHRDEGAVVCVLRDMTALRKLTTMRRDFVANVSHELRTPVTAIQGYAETLLSGTADQETARQFLEVVHRQAQRIGALVEQLLALSEIEGRSPGEVAREDVRVASVAHHVAEAMQGRATKRGVDVRVDVEDDIVVAADPDGLERALLNLVDNAIKYGKEQGTVRIEAKRAGGAVEITVADDGPGIPSEHAARIFERFYRIDPGRSRQHGGAGLGLSIVKHLVEAMDGTVTLAKSGENVGSGTAFVVRLRVSGARLPLDLSVPGGGGLSNGSEM